MARDCTVNRDPNAPPAPPTPSMGRGGFDSEYASLMAELGEPGAAAPDMSKPSWAAGPRSGHDITGGGTNIPPWRRPENWQAPVQNPQQRPAQGGYGGGYGAGGGGGQWGGYPQQQPDYNYASYYQGQYAQQQAS